MMGGSDRETAVPDPGWMPGSVAACASCVRVQRPSALSRVLLATCVLIGAFLLSSVPARAAAEVNHVFGGVIKGKGKCALLEPGAVAVRESTGEVWVIDRGKSQVDRIAPDGTCLSSPKVNAPEFVAVDQTTGDAYVAVAVEAGSEERIAIDKFSPEGKLIHRIRKFKTSPGEPLTEFAERGPIIGLGVDGSGSLWVYQGEVIDQFSSGEPNAFVSALEPEASACGALPGFAASPDAQFFYIGRERENHSGGCEEATVLVKLNSSGQTASEPEPGEPGIKAQLDNEPTTAAAVDTSNQVFFGNITSVAAFNGRSQFIQRFANEGGAASLSSGTGVAVDSAHNKVYAADAAERVVKIYIATAAEERKPELTADGRSWEQVTPQNKLGATIYGINKEFGVDQASEDGSALTYVSNTPIVSDPPTNRAPEPTQNLSRRGSSSWGTQDIAPPAGSFPTGYVAGSGTEYEFFSSKLASGLVNPQEHERVFKNEPLLSPEASEGTPYLRNLTVPSSSCEPLPSSCYQALVSARTDGANPFQPFGGLVHFTSATPDARHAVLRSEVPLSAEAAEHKLQQGLYEVEPGGDPQLVSVLPRTKGETPEEAKLREEEEQQLSVEGGDLRLGGQGENNGGVMRNAISDDGSRVVWSTERGVGKLYLRDTAKHETIRIDSVPSSQKGEVAQPQTGASFQAADTKGTRIFFTDKQRLTKDSTIEEGAEETEGLGDLYVCEVVEEAGGGLGCNLTDLTARVEGVTASNEGAATQGVLGASDDGSYVYYVANGVFDTHAGHGTCEPRGRGELPGRSCNLYVQHISGSGWSAPRFIRSLSGEDQNDWHIEAEGGALLGVTSRVSPHGTFLAFMSKRSLTGYNNVDASKEAEGAHDEEVYLYDASANLVKCPSCNPDGSQPSGVFDGTRSGEGLGLLIDRPLLWGGQWVAADIPGWTTRSKEAAVYQSRYLSDTGRLFFNSASPLVPTDTNRKADVYEFEPNGEGSCTSANGCVSLLSSGGSPQESAFVDASSTGNDVFFLTSAKLEPEQDLDGAFDIYDAHVCTPSSPCVPENGKAAQPCAGEEPCKGPAGTVPAAPGAPASSLLGSGNAGTHEVLSEKKAQIVKKKETRAQKLAKALRACNKVKKKSKRAACRRLALKKYGPIKKSAKSHKVKKK
jgi:DNA-binding beta-propeller fold protein YncE